jgi:GNAT superfamily N-acetyltransferase
MNLQPREFSRGDFAISSDAARLDLVWVHDYLANHSYWARGISYEVFHKSVGNSLCFGIYQNIEQVGFARVVSDFATSAFLADVFIAENQQGKGLGKWLVACILGYPELQGLRRWMLLTKDAHGFYEQYGFTPVKRPGDVMEWLPS